jgi:hypothetical protein
MVEQVKDAGSTGRGSLLTVFLLFLLAAVAYCIYYEVVNFAFAIIVHRFWLAAGRLRGGYNNYWEHTSLFWKARGPSFVCSGFRTKFVHFFLNEHRTSLIIILHSAFRRLDDPLLRLYVSQKRMLTWQVAGVHDDDDDVFLSASF